MSFWTCESVRSAVGGVWAARPQGAGELAGVSIDSRTIRPGEAFFAFKGERFDGHDFVGAAVDAGAGMVVLERPEAARGLSRAVGVARVADARKALFRLAKAYRRRLEGVKVVAVTGSVGKTTTVRLIEAALSRRLRVTASQKSFNNDIGVPLTLLRARASDQAVICEVGMNSPGEIATLAALLEPDVAVITRIGRAHIGHLGSREAIAREKASLLTFLRPGGLAVIPADEPLLDDYAKTIAHVATFGAGAGADIRVSDVRTEGGRVRFTLGGRSAFEVPMLGEHNAMNAAAAAAAARRFGLDEETVRAGLAGASPPANRMQVREVGGVTVYNDAYNASPESALAAVATFSESARGAGRRVIVLGDMRELGEFADQAHAEVAEAALGAGNIDALIAVGPLAGAAAERVRREWGPGRVASLPDVEGANAARAADLLRPGDAALLKGSRSMALERVEQALAGRGAPEAAPAPG
ncbi:MAG: UDP-N-acetylmuramoyl-tripeptide--D-alanyl-D-alanine ligase [Phycisphaerales bacterium]|nr:UDP-N-acetylmuramoyl-tripeptide--D-alanyl-D-alanine ligase [Phycisphaerales bacterium]